MNNSLYMYLTFTIAMILDLAAGYLHLIDSNITQVVFVGIITLLTGIHINLPSGVTASPLSSNQEKNV